MAKPIRATPKLRGEEANEFVKRMIIVEKTKLSKIDRDLIRKIEENKNFFKLSQEIPLV